MGLLSDDRADASCWDLLVYFQRLQFQHQIWFLFRSCNTFFNTVRRNNQSKVILFALRYAAGLAEDRGDQAISATVEHLDHFFLLGAGESVAPTS